MSLVARIADVDVGGHTIRTAVTGEGPPLLLLHGFPETHRMWDAVTERLASQFTVVATDLRGYGASTTPGGGYEAAAKREMAHDQVAVMTHLGFEEFALCGHDRGARCAFRLALDHPRRVRCVAVLDVVPTPDVLERLDDEVAVGLWRWWVMAQPAPGPESLITAAPDSFLFSGLQRVCTEDALAHYRAAAADPTTLGAMCDDYRAMVAVDLAHDRADRTAGKRIAAPLLVLWGQHSNVERWHDVLAVWRSWADDVRGAALDCGHYLPEERPDEVAEALRDFVTR